MKSRKKNLLFIQLTIFLLAVALLYNTYSDNNKESETFVKVETETNPDTNSFTDIEYSGFDLTGNRYLLKAGKADFKTATPELINMKKVEAKFYLKDNTILTVISEEGLYNNISDSLSFSNSNAKLIATGNVRGESIEKGECTADNVEYNITDKTLNLSMFGNEQIKLKLKN